MERSLDPRARSAQSARMSDGSHGPDASRARERVLVAMSGGVDSSLAAALLHEAGHDVVGVTLHLWDAEGAQQVGRCCAPEDREDARRTCELLGVPHYVLDERAAFRRHVVDPFVADNLAGRTPIPCVQCNQQVKLARLWEIARALGASRVATGHYAQLERAEDGQVRLLRGADGDKDQSYFLFGVPQAVLRRMIFPLGALTKPAAREEARRLGLPNWNKPDSQELCFIPDGDVRGFVARERPGQAGVPGPVLDEQGARLGEHGGIEGFTIGQRRGLGIAGAAARYVLRIVPEQNAVVIGEADRLLRSRLSARSAAWLEPPPDAPFEAEVRIRYRHAPARARVRASDGGFDVEFAEPQRAVAPGQAAVVYRGERVLGGGFIDG
jgi:tRNA-specific 2-thiouridylase